MNALSSLRNLPLRLPAGSVACGVRSDPFRISMTRICELKVFESFKTTLSEASKPCSFDEMNDGERRAFDAEVDVQDAMDSMECTLDTWRGLRIPKSLSRIGSGEVDVIALTDQCIVMIEVKFSKGKLSVDSNRCIQQNGRTPNLSCRT